ncbi:MAG: VanW family protein [Clostridia bacterium]|nr:VanW family protein [Clostridia bacterium]
MQNTGSTQKQETQALPSESEARQAPAKPTPARPRPKGASPRRRKKRSSLPSVILACLVLVGLMVASARFFHVRSVVRSVSGTFCPGVYVNNVSLGGMTWDEAIDELNDIASERLDAVYTFTYGDQEWDFAPSAVGAALDIEYQAALAFNLGHTGNLKRDYESILRLREEPAYFQSSLTYDEDMIEDFIEEIRSEIDLEPVDAEVLIDTSGPKLIRESATGRKLDVVSLRTALTSLVVNGEGETTLYVETLHPEISSEQAESGMARLVRIRTDVTFRGPSSLHNVRLALSKFNSMIVYPGDVVDFNAVVGKRTEENGFLEAPEYAGNRTTNGIGGGVCQASTTLYDAMLKAGMTILQRSPHTMTVSYVDPSLDAAVSENVNGPKNLVFRNDRTSPIYIYTDVTSEYATVYVYGERTEYRIELESHIRASEPITEMVLEDFTATYVTYDDEAVVVSEGKKGYTSEGYIVYYDWDTGAEVERRLLTRDSYSPSPRITYVGISPRVGIIPDY